MERENRAKLTDIVATLLDVEPAAVTDRSSPETIENWDSLNHLNICVAVGQEFGLELSTEEMANIRCVGDLAGVLRSRGVPCAMQS